jgi:hypothetical protein
MSRSEITHWRRAFVPEGAPVHTRAAWTTWPANLLAWDRDRRFHRDIPTGDYATRLTLFPDTGEAVVRGALPRPNARGHEFACVRGGLLKASDPAFPAVTTLADEPVPLAWIDPRSFWWWDMAQGQLVPLVRHVRLTTVGPMLDARIYRPGYDQPWRGGTSALARPQAFTRTIKAHCADVRATARMLLVTRELMPEKTDFEGIMAQMAKYKEVTLSIPGTTNYTEKGRVKNTPLFAAELLALDLTQIHRAHPVQLWQWALRPVVMERAVEQVPALKVRA